MIRMSEHQRDLLLEHANGPRPNIAGADYHSKSRLEYRGLIRYSADKRFTVATQSGRELIVELLAIQAETLADSEVV